MPQQIDEASYNEGRADFDNGVSLRQVIERVMREDEKAQDEKAPDDIKALSAAIGFADALLDLLRRPAVSLAGGDLIETL